ncbi:protein TraE [Serratia liquefaciens]|uniref:protein TraE n=1 Tax=Serratia liquefaciens TaxID=614 RepID=UPI003905D61B
MNTQNDNTAALEPSEKWEAKASLFETQELGRYSVKFSAPCIGGGVNLNCSHVTNAVNAFDAVVRFTRETHAVNCVVYDVEQTEEVRAVCVSTAGYRFVQRGYIWLCLDTGVIVDVSPDGSMRRGDDGQPIPAFGKLTRI